MSREPRGVTAHKLVAATEPYLKHQNHGTPAVVASAAASGAAGVSMQTINSVRQFEQIQRKRVKPLPPDANTSNLVAHDGSNTRVLNLYQLEDMIYFSCAKCRKVNIHSDLVAVNTEYNNLMCSRCFTRLIRPKNFKPTRLVPFPSLLSWLNYSKPAVFDGASSSALGGSDHIAQRFAEAVVPTGDRLATSMAVNGFASNADVRSLPSNAFLTEISENDQYGQQALAQLQTTHPCHRLWGSNKCAHGAQICAFAKAPFNQAIEFLMGIATKEQCLAEGLIVDEVFDLPKKNDLIPCRSSATASGASTTPIAKSPADIHNADTALGQWYQRRLKSLNQPEWQLFNNGPIEPIISKYCGNYFAALAVEEDTTRSSAAAAAVSGEDDDHAAHDAHIAALMEEEDDGVEGGGGGGDDDDDLGALLDTL